MPNYEVQASCRVPSGFAVDQVRGMFDLAVEKTASVRYNVELPAEDELIDGRPWRVGVIVGPSGSGKSTVARQAYGERFVEGLDWPADKAVVDCFPGVSVKALSQTLTSVGFSSPPAWVKPYAVLSGGEKFRCDLARALLTTGDEVVAFDEFTSVVDRNVAKIGSAAIAKAVRKDRFGPAKQFVAVTCHYDVLDWLEADWVLDMSSQQLARGRLHRRPDIELRFAPVHRSAWKLFRQHHYLNTTIATTATSFAAFWGDEPVAFSAWIHHMTKKRGKRDMREHRTVVLPDFQGVGIGNRVSEMAASVWSGVAGRAFSTTSHPGMIHYRAASPLWRTKRFGHVQPMGARGRYGRELLVGVRSKASSSASRITGGFQYVGPPMDTGLAEAMLAAKPRVFAPEGAMRGTLLALLDSPGVTPVGRLARIAGYSPHGVQRACEELHSQGCVERVRVGARVAWGLTPEGRQAYAGLPSVS